MERKFLEDLGLAKEAVESIMAQNGKDIEAHKTAAEAAGKDRDTYKVQLADVSTKLKAFDGVDIEALRGEIDTLKGDLAKNEADFTSQIAERDFSALLDAAVTEAKGKNPKAIKALLDVDALKSSKNQKEDAAVALKKLAESDAYLFGTENTPPITVSTGGKHSEEGGGAGDANATMNNFIRGAVKGD